jgi:hypothetical protein
MPKHCSRIAWLVLTAATLWPSGAWADRAEDPSHTLIRLSRELADLKAQLADLKLQVTHDSEGNGLVMISDNHGRKRLEFGCDVNQRPYEIFYNWDGKAVMWLSCDGEGSPHIVVGDHGVADLAEVFDLVDDPGLAPGSVVAVRDGSQALVPSGGAYDSNVIGVVSGAGSLKPGMVMGVRADGTRDRPVAVSGQVYVRACVEGGAIHAGDLLVASSRPGVAMKLADATRGQGAVLGKALESLPSVSREQEGLVRIVVMLR